MSNRHLALKEKPLGKTRALFPVVGGLRHPSVRWTCSHRAGHSDIEAYVLATDGLEIIATTQSLQGVDAHANAELIVEAVNDYQKYKPLISELLSALRLCLKCDGLSWEAQRETEIVVRKVKGF